MMGKGSRDLPYDLENMSIPDLEALLQQDFIATNGSAPDVDYIMAIMEVIQKKDQVQPDYQPLDAEKAWEEFQAFYNTEEGRANSIYCSDEENGIPKDTEQPPSRKKLKPLRWYFLVAALIAALAAVTMIPVSGYSNVIQMMIAYWTDDYFSFVPSGKEPEPILDSDAASIPDEFLDLYDVLTKSDIEKIAIPRYIPEELEVDDSVLFISPKTGAVDFSIQYQSTDDFLIFRVTENQSSQLSIVEKDAETVEKYHLDGIEYHFFNNNEVSSATWNADRLEYAITSSLSVESLKEMINSIQI